MYLGGMNRIAILRCGLTDAQLTANVNIAEKILCRIVKEIGFKKVLEMAEYIERENAIAWFMPYVHAGESIDADIVISDIKGMKAADVAQVRHGRWIWETEDVYKCSNCGDDAHVKEVMGKPSFDYCPNCGARIREDSDGEK